MSSFADSTQIKVKQVLRTAMVGIQPGDQVILKGYFRVLLRLEVDLEWVAANAPSVDLFLINNQFRLADSVVRLLEVNPDKPVLYVVRGTEESGGLTDDIITLPLKKLHGLNDWLFSQVDILQMHGSKHRQTVDDSELTIKNNNALNQIENNTEDKKTNNLLAEDENSTEIINQQGDLLLHFVIELELREDKYYELWVKDEFVGLIHSQRQCIWLSHNAGSRNFGPDGTWKLKETQRQPTEKNKYEDLVQWLWMQALQKPDALLSLLSVDQEFQLRFWLKPPQDNSRREILRLFTALETQPRTLLQLVDITGATKEMVSKVLVGLLFSGGLIPSIHKVLKADIEGYNKAVLNIENSHSESASVETVSKTKSIDDILARRKAGEVAPTLSSSYEMSDALKPKPKPTPSPETSKSEAEPTTKKRGFLSRLRDKLGL